MDLREINFGVEIETVKRTRERVARAIHSVVDSELLFRLAARAARSGQMDVAWFKERLRCGPLEPFFQLGCTSVHPTALVADSCLPADGLHDLQMGPPRKIPLLFALRTI